MGGTRPGAAKKKKHQQLIEADKISEFFRIFAHWGI